MQQRHKHLVQGHAEHRRLIRGLAGVGALVDRILAHRNALNRKNRKLRLLVVVPGVVTVRTFQRRLRRINKTLENNLGRRRYLQIGAQALHQLGFSPAQKAGKLIFRDIVGHRRYRGENGRRIATDHRRNLKRLTGIGQAMIAKIERTTAMGQPAHDHLVAPDNLLTIDTEILPRLVGPTRHRQAPRNQWRHVARPAVLDRQTGKIDILTFPDDLLARRRGDDFRRHIEHLFENRQLIPGVLHALRWLRLFKIGKQFAHLAQGLDRFLPHTQSHAAWRSEQIGQDRHGS